MKNCKVKGHMRNGKKVRGHKRNIKNAYPGPGFNMSEKKRVMLAKMKAKNDGWWNDPDLQY